ncbi:MAG: hypothetical protein ACJA2X_002291 [Halocynthiibacter sp.]|jgi:hypothetical protein
MAAQGKVALAGGDKPFVVRGTSGSGRIFFLGENTQRAWPPISARFVGSLVVRSGLFFPLIKLSVKQAQAVG